MTGPIRIIVVDDHPLLLDGLVATLAADDELEIVATGGDASAAVRAAREHQPDLALLDVAMPGGGIEAARQIEAASPGTRVVMLTSSEDEDDLLAAMNAGAKGYVLKGVAGRELRSILKSVQAGEVYVAPGLAYAMIRGLTKPRTHDPIDELTSREREVLDLVGAGLSNAEIGGRLGLAEKTVKHYMTAILGKLEVGSRVEAALVAYKAGLGAVPPGSPHADQRPCVDRRAPLRRRLGPARTSAMRARPRAEPRAAGSSLHAELLEIELLLDGAQDEVVDLAAIAQLDDRRPLGADHPALDLLVLDPLLAPLGGLVRILGRQVLGSIAEA